MKCILCKDDSRLKVLQKLCKNSLNTLYEQYFGIDTKYIVDCDLIYMHCDNCDINFFVGEDQNIKVGDDKFYNSLNKLSWYYFDEKHEYEHAIKFIDEGSSVLEVGCGKGAFLKILKTKNIEKYVGLELSTDAKSMAEIDGIDIENITIEEYAKTSSKKFDVACSFQVLEHTSDPHSFIKSQISCLNGGGRLIIAVPSEDSFIKYCVNGILNMPPHHISRYSDRVFHNIAKIFNIDLLEIYHEPIQNEHISYYQSTMWSKIFLPTPLIDTGLVRKVVNKIGIAGKKLIKIPDNAYGHTVVAVYKTKT